MVQALDIWAPLGKGQHVSSSVVMDADGDVDTWTPALGMERPIPEWDISWELVPLGVIQ